MRLKHYDGYTPLDITQFVNKNNIKKEDILATTFDSVINRYHLFYWVKDEKEMSSIEEDSNSVSEESKIVETLSLVLEELNAREKSNNCPTCLRAFNWNKLCDMGIELFEQLKQEKNK